MLLSHRHQFLFVHIAKTGGSSIRAALRRQTWSDPLVVPTFLCHRLSHLTDHRIGAKFPRHAAAVAAKESLAPSHFDALFKFAFVRNPWDRLVSAYHHFQREHDSLLRSLRIHRFPDFAKWIVQDAMSYRGRKHVLVAAIRRPQVEHVIDLTGATIVNFIGRYENLIDDFSAVCGKIGVPPQPLPHKRKSERKQDFRFHYDTATAELTGRYFQADAQTFAYAFEPRESVADASSEPSGVPRDRGRIAC